MYYSYRYGKKFGGELFAFTPIGEIFENSFSKAMCTRQVDKGFKKRTYPAFSDATIDMWGSLVSCWGDGPDRGTIGAIFCSVFAVMPATWKETRDENAISCRLITADRNLLCGELDAIIHFPVILCNESNTGEHKPA